jgi:DNA polymerase I-like protein with 3'-5' exonuclease and polymerase domains
MLTVHDSIVFSIHKDKVHEAVALIEKTMCDVPVETDTPFFVDTGIGPDYAYACDEEKGGYDPNRDYTTWSFE